MDQILDMPETRNDINVEYAGFWIRFGAVVIDGILLLIVRFVLAALTGDGIIVGLNNSVVVIASLVIGYIYEAGMISSQYQATLGKLAVGIKVTDLNGERISFGRSTGRHFAKIISALIIFIGYIMIVFNDKKQALHDTIAKTYVVYKK